MKCEFCHKRVGGGEGLVICANCTKQIDDDFNAQEAAKRIKAAKRKCQTCTRPLVPSRYFHCYKCVPPEDSILDVYLEAEHEI